MKTCYTAILGSVYDDLKEPTVISPDWQYICYTDQSLTSKVWQIIQVPSTGNPQRQARAIKITAFSQWRYSLWLDASFQINMDLNKLWDNYFKAPFTAPRHPLRHCIYHEIDSCIANQRGDAKELLAQKAAYAAEGIPHNSNTIVTSGLLMRKNTPECVALCKDWLAELQQWSVRDQVAFGKVSIGREFYTINWDYSQSKEILYKRHMHLR